METFSVFYIVLLISLVACLPLEESGNDDSVAPTHSLKKRFINPLFSSGAAGSEDLVKIRAKRSEEDCEKLRLCKLHARAGRNFFSAFELYFVNKENARLWDHRARSPADCEQRYGRCYYK